MAKIKKRKPRTLPKPIVIARAFAKHGYQLETIAGHYQLQLGTVEFLLAKYINAVSGWHD